MGPHQYPSLGRTEFRLSLLVLLVSFVSGSGRAQSPDICGPTPAVKAALAELPDYRESPALTDWQVHQQRLATLQALLRQYPDDVFVQRAYIRSMGTMRGTDTISVAEKDKVIAEYKARHEQDPDNAQLAYLYGLTLVGRDSPQAIKLFNAALQRNPKFELPHLELVTIFSSPVFKNEEQRTAHLKAFLDACPTSLEGYDRLSEIADKDLLRAYAGKLRSVLQNRSDSDVVEAYHTLWTIEFKTHPPSEYESLRRQVGQDLERLRQINLQNRWQWYELEDGYKLANDQKQADWAEEQAKERFPSANELPETAKWYKDHPGPASEATPDTKRAYYRDLLAQTGQWLNQHPSGVLINFFLWRDRLEALEHLDDSPAADVETAVDQMLKFAGENMNDGPWSDDYSFAAEILAKKHLEPQREVDFAQKGLDILEIEAKAPGDDLYDTKERLDDSKFLMALRRLGFLKYEIDGYLQMKQPAKAQPLLEQMNQWVQDFKPLAENEKKHELYEANLAGYWGLRAQEAELQGHKLDAMAFYENALLARLDAQENPETGEKDELADNAHRLWKGLGGTEDGWQLWYGRAAAELAARAGLTWEDANLPLPAFELADLSGKAWNLASLKGKVTLMNFWASW